MNEFVWFAVALGYVHAFVNRSETKKHCQNELLDQGWLEIVLPSWADETGKVSRGAPASLPPVQRPSGKRDVAPGLMGDPPKGRSALDQRK